jgi:hypothetical protein
VAVSTGTAINTATRTVVAVLLSGGTIWRKAFKNRFRAVYRPFPPVFPIAAMAQSPKESGTRRFSAARAPSRNGENGENRPPANRIQFIPS